jgi:hypothetical protein
MIHSVMEYPIKAPGYEHVSEAGETRPFPVLRTEPKAPPAPHPHGLEGDVQFLPIATVLQALASTRKPATLLFPLAPKQTAPSQLASLGAWAGIAMYDGRFLDARLGEHTGMEALLRLMLVERGRFETWFDVILWPVADTHGHALDGALLNASVTIDHWVTALPIPSLDTPLRSRDISAVITARSFLLDWPGTLEEGVDLMLQALESGSLVRVDEPLPGSN